MKYATYHIYIINVYFCIVFMHIVGEFSTFVLSEEQWPFILVFSRIYYGLVKMMISLFKTCIFFSLFTYIFFSYVHSGSVVDRAEPSQAGSVSSARYCSARYCSARFGIFVEYRAEPYNNHFQIIV